MGTAATKEPQPEQVRRRRRRLDAFDEAPGEIQADEVSREFVQNLGTDVARQAEGIMVADGGTRERAVSRMQQERGNRQVQRVVRQAVQRQPQPAPIVTPLPDPAQQNLPSLKVHHIRGGPHFDVDFDPVGPVPKVGKVEILLKVFVDFQDFKKEFAKDEPFKSYFKLHPLTRDQKADFVWTTEEKRVKGDKFKADFKKSVAEGWSGKHQLHLSEPGFAEHRAAVTVRVETSDTEAGAHIKVKVQKVPKDVKARFRSYVSGDRSEAVLDYRDPSEPEKRKNEGYATAFVRQVKTFENDSPALTSDMPAQLDDIAEQARKAKQASKKPGKPDPEWIVDLVGRASSPGLPEHNKKLGKQRAETVQAGLESRLTSDNIRVRSDSVGETHASADERFRRVDVEVWNVTKMFEEDAPEIEQNVAAHEAGHMFGLDDEYVEEKPEKKDFKPKFKGDETEDYQKIRDLMGKEAADETLMRESESMMSGGNVVKKGHYVYFLEALNDMTGHRWSVE